MYDELKKQMLQLDVQNAAADAVSQSLQSSQNKQQHRGIFQVPTQPQPALFNGSSIRESNGFHTSGSSGSGGRISPVQGVRKPGYGNIYGQQGI